jgi:hypothetical protein
LLTRYAVPLYRYDARRRPEQFATGFFVRVDQAHFLVSAAHVLRESQQRNLFFYAAQKTLRHLRGRITTTGDAGGFVHDPLDVAVLRLEGNAVPPFPEVEKVALDLSALRPEYLPRSAKQYVVVGFPATKSRIDPLSRRAIVQAYAYDSASIGDAAYEAHELSAATHIILPFDRKRTLATNGLTVAFPKPQGMSGSPILVLYEADEFVMKTEPGFALVGVAVRSLPGAKILVGTDVRFVREMILQHLAGG